ncbi:hypothetical protein [Streptomyces sp. ISL-11]|uniref:hypothetical protein n=1 Tax=Streptomyces sp. ISL-11 TaxID=2819174 RepID=UPI001BEABBD9|nr:hypothetical protein [Streptomyces sp. ISL-11]MBT2385334.1 hypothetical protein [Streptomyces sp. ISL-11]
MTDDIENIEDRIIIDLDRAAAEITGRLAGWRARGLVAGAVTWVDLDAPWPQPLETDRARVARPYSVGIQVEGPGDSGLSVVLFRDGRADVDFLAVGADEVRTEAPDSATPRAFGAVLDDCVGRAFGTGRLSSPRP